MQSIAEIYKDIVKLKSCKIRETKWKNTVQTEISLFDETMVDCEKSERKIAKVEEKVKLIKQAVPTWSTLLTLIDL